MSRVTCKQCGWVHFQVSSQYIDKWEADWKIFWAKSSQETREAYGCPNEPPKRDGYYKCFFCGGDYTNFRDFKAGDCPEGCTIQPILSRME